MANVSGIAVARLVLKLEELFHLGLDSFKVGVEQVIQHASLRRTDLLAALGKLVAFEQSDLVSELLDDGFIVVDFSAHRLDLGLQLQRLCRQGTKLFRGQLVMVGPSNR